MLDRLVWLNVVIVCTALVTWHVPPREVNDDFDWTDAFDAGDGGDDGALII